MPTPVVLRRRQPLLYGSRDLRLHVQVASEDGGDRRADAYRVALSFRT
jgi:hypothetical protein